MKASNGKKGYQPESKIIKLAKSGALDSIGKNAIAESFKKGLSVTVLEDGAIYRLHPDGSRTFIKLVGQAAKHYTTGKFFIK